MKWTRVHVHDVRADRYFCPTCYAWIHASRVRDCLHVVYVFAHGVINEEQHAVLPESMVHG